ncbi:MAG TPA: hypothetical protein VK796_09060 [Cytophaga sp.]|nr:hypothetical protein [Cytophaga sp.]
MKKLSVLIVLLSTTFCCFSQWTPSVGMIANITPTYNIAGTDTNVENTLTVAPSFTIRNKAGWGLTYSPSFLTGGAKSGLFMHSIKAGVEQYDKKIMDYTANYIHYFFTGNTSVPYSPLTNEISASIVYKKRWLHPTFEAGIGFGTDTSNGGSASAFDAAIAVGAAHTFSKDFDSTVDITLTPALVLNAGTNDYFSLLSFSKYIGHGKKSISYIKNGKAKAVGRNNGNGNTNTSTITNSTFSLSNIETKFEASVEVGSLEIRPTASLFFPVGRFSDTGIYGFWEITATYSF